MKAIFPGSFDPITRGHVELVRSALPLFDTIYVAIGVNADKSGFFPIQRRKQWIAACFANEQKVQVIDYQNLTVDLCKELGVSYIIRGLRNSIDFQYENDIAQANRQLCPEVETMFFATRPEYAHISSSVVRDVFRHHGNWRLFVPEEVSLDL